MLRLRMSTAQPTCAALQTSQAQAQQAVTGEAPRIVRNVGSGGSPDLHLENFSVSNGGPDLIENASLLLALGRRWVNLLDNPDALLTHRQPWHITHH